MNNSPALKTLLSTPLLILCLAFALTACQSGSEGENAPPVAEMTMADYAFGTPETVPAGWVTFQMDNVGEESHEFVLGRLPEGKTLEDYRSDLVEPVDSLDQLLAEGDIDSTEYGEALQRALPKWIDEIEGGGGGFLGPGQAGRTTLDVKPGTYVISCWISSPNGRRHASQGMIQSLTVSDDSSGAEAPEADVTLRSAGREVNVEGAHGSGEQTIAFRVEEPPEDLDSPYDRAKLAPLGRETSAEDLRNHGEHTHSVKWQGGVLSVPTGKTGYATVDLEPGRYGWVFSRIGEEETVVKEFTVE